MASTQKAKSKKIIKISSQRKNLPSDEWIAESEDPILKGKVLCFPTVVIKNYRTNELSTLSLKVLELMTGLCSRSRIIYEPELHMLVISEYPLPENMHKSDTVKSDRLPSLCALSYHSKDDLIPKPLVTDLINQRIARWGCSLNPRGDIQYLNGIWEWSQQIYRKLLDKGFDELAYDVHATSFDYSRPNSVYRALCEVWCPQTNTFVTGLGEIGISLWEMRHVTNLSIRGEYFEEVIPSLTELRDSDTSTFPVTCLYLFKAFVLINKKKGDNRPRHSNWLDFWFKDGARASDPKKSMAYKVAMANCFKRDGEFFAKRRLVRPIQAEIQLMKTKVNGDDPFILLDLDLDVTTREDLEIAAYLGLWLCRFVFPSSDDVNRPTIFKTASRMAAKVTYSLVLPIVSSIYKGLSETCSTQYDQKNLGMASYAFPGHYFYAWAALHFSRRVYAEVDEELDRPLLRQFRGTLNAYIFYEEEAKGFRDLLRESMSSNDFFWQPVLYSGNRGPRRDDGQDQMKPLN